MHSDKLIDRMETYSNAIVGFIVAQSLAFSFTLANNERFSGLVKEPGPLGIGLLLHFLLSTALAVSAIQFLSTRMRLLSQDNATLITALFQAKAVTVLLFALIPILLLAWLFLK